MGRINGFATISSTGLVTAIIGGENASVEWAATATATTSDNGATGRILIKSFAFAVFPRQTALAWGSRQRGRVLPRRVAVWQWTWTWCVRWDSSKLHDLDTQRHGDYD